MTFSSSIRHYQTADRTACEGILESNRPEYFSEEDANEYASFLDDIPGEYFVTEREGRVIACGGWAREKNGSVSLTWGMVHRDFHGQGIGSALLHHRLDDARKAAKNGIVQLITIPLTAAFFERAGFDIIDVEPDGFGPGMDKVTMRFDRSSQAS